MNPTDYIYWAKGWAGYNEVTSTPQGVFGFEYGKTVVRYYPDGLPLVDFIRCDRLMVRSPKLSLLMATLFLADAQAERGLPVPELVLPFIDGRQDRLNDTGDYLFTAKSLAREINMRNFPRVTIFDPHSDVISGLIDRCRVVHAHDILAQHPDRLRWEVVIAPDAGAEKRAAGVARMLGVPLLRGWKVRDVKTGAIDGFGMQMCDGGRRALVVDDICDGGGTFVGLCDVIRERALVADLYVTHGIFSKGTEELHARFERIYCTDSFDADRPHVRVIDTCERYCPWK